MVRRRDLAMSSEQVVPEARRQREAVLGQLDALIRDMSEPLRRLDRWRGWHQSNGGWTEDRRRDWLEFFTELRKRVAGGDTSFDAEADHLVRALDQDSIVGSPWLERAAEIQDSLNELRAAERRH